MFINPLSPTLFLINESTSVQRHTVLTHHFLIFDIRALWRSVLSARVPECQKIKNGGLDQYGQYGLGHCEVQPFNAIGLERVKRIYYY